MADWLLIIASIVHAAFRLAYFFYIGLTLKARHSDRLQSADTHHEWLRFKKKAEFILNADGLSLGIVVLLSAGSLSLRASFLWTLGIGIAMILAGVAVKVAAYRVVGIKGYYWYNFFCGDDEREYVAKGIYRYIDNPMYTLGYLHAFGFGVVFRSSWGLLCAAFDVLVLWAFHYLFERPHTKHYRDVAMQFDSATREEEPVSRQ